MSENDLKFTDDARMVGRSRLWLPVVLAMLMFLAVAGAFMIISSISYDISDSTAPGAIDQP